MTSKVAHICTEAERKKSAMAATVWMISCPFLDQKEIFERKNTFGRFSISPLSFKQKKKF